MNVRSAAEGGTDNVYRDDALYQRGAATLTASWREDARGSDGASLQLLNGVAAAVFPRGPERNYLNNALFERRLSIQARAKAIAAMENAYAAACITRFAAWVRTKQTARCTATSNGAGTASTPPPARWA